ncbi:GtrA family protein [Herbaspirillum sp. B65]|uniref:GtrA family protein n=1 Tax=Herbaspirillum sp. B65 TaxID=137708 RepID=UPI0035B55BC6
MALSRFIVAGAANTGLTYLCYLTLILFMPYALAYSLTYLVGIGIGYSLNTYWVFKKKVGVRSAMLYPLIYAGNYLFGIGLLWFSIEWLRIPKEIAPLLVTTISVPIMYFLSKWIFSSDAHHEETNN